MRTLGTPLEPAQRPPGEGSGVGSPGIAEFSPEGGAEGLNVGKGRCRQIGMLGFKVGVGTGVGCGFGVGAGVGKG